MSNCVNMSECKYVCCFASCWIGSMLFAQYVDVTYIRSGDPNVGFAIVWISTSIITLTIGCNLCYCLNKCKCCNAFATSKTTKIDTTETIVDQYPNASIHTPSQPHITVIFMFHKYFDEIRNTSFHNDHPN